MTELFKYSEAPDRGMAIEDPVASALSHLQGRTNYALVGQNAVAVHVPGWYNIRVPLYVVGDTNHTDVQRANLSILDEGNVIGEARQMDVQYDGTTFHVAVAKPEHVITESLITNERESIDAFRLIRHLRETLDVELVRNLLKAHENYDQLYTKLVHAIYELAR